MFKDSTRISELTHSGVVKFCPGPAVVDKAVAAVVVKMILVLVVSFVVVVVVVVVAFVVVNVGSKTLKGLGGNVSSVLIICFSQKMTWVTSANTEYNSSAQQEDELHSDIPRRVTAPWLLGS